MLRPRPARAFVLVAVAALVGCGGNDPTTAGAGSTTSSEPASSTTSADTTTTTAPAETTTTTEAAGTTATTATDDEGIGDVEAFAADLLVTLDELGEPSFADVGYTPDAEPGPCGVDVDAEFPADVLVGATYISDELQLGFQQEIRVFADGEAPDAFEAGIDSLGCGTTADGTATLSEPTDVSELVGTAAFAVELEGGGTEAVLVATLIEDAIVTFVFSGAEGASQAANAPDPIDVAAFGVGKILAALGE